MIRQEFTVNNPSGLHARPASLFTDALKKHTCTASISCNGKTKNAKSMIGLLALGIKKGTNFELTLDGEDEVEAIKEITALVEANFYEGE